MQTAHLPPTRRDRPLRPVPSTTADVPPADGQPDRWVPVRHLRLELGEGELLLLLLRAGWLRDVAPLLAGLPSPAMDGDGHRLVRLRWRPDLLLVHLRDVALVREVAARADVRPQSA
ncbi:MAG: hypothetical protein ACTHQ3_19190 [Motilibacteraceae bacterium]